MRAVHDQEVLGPHGLNQALGAEVLSMLACQFSSWIGILVMSLPSLSALFGPREIESSPFHGLVSRAG